MSLIIHKFFNAPVTSCCYILSDKDVSGSCIVIDPGNEDISEITGYIKKNDITPEYIILTHEHFDHCLGVNNLRGQYPDLKLVCSEICSQNIQNEKRNCSVFYDNTRAYVINPADIIVEEIGMEMTWNSHNIRIIRTPGHTPASISIKVENNIFTGDAWIKGLKTVTKLPGGNKQQQIETEALLHSFNGYTCWPGHGDKFEIGN